MKSIELQLYDFLAPKIKRVILCFIGVLFHLSAYTQSDLFAPSIAITNTSNGAESVFSSDLDGDGDQDVLSVSYLDDNITWYENDGNGNFIEQNIVNTLADGLQAVYIKDLDGDGDQDLLSASYVDDKIAWYENVGMEIFGGQNIISLQADAASSVFAADLDGDGDQDVLSASSEDDKIAWYENNGLGFFGDQIVISIQADYAQSVYAADLDGDGDEDVLSASSEDNKIAWYENDGNGNFGEQKVISLETTWAQTVATADLDEDGDQDVLTLSYDDYKIAWYENDGNGNFGWQKIISIQTITANSVFSSDLDGDGDQDMLTASYNNNKIVWYENEGNGNFGVQNIINTQAVGAISACATDLDGDGDQDVISASLEDDKIAWYENQHLAKADFVYDKCIVNSVSYTIINSSNFTLDSLTNYAWIFDDEVVSTDINLDSNLLPSSGHFSLTLISCTSASCDTITKQIDVLQFDLDTIPLLHTNVPFTFTNVSNNIGYWVWEFGDGGIAEVQIPTYTYTEPGVYELEVNVYYTVIAEDCFHQLEYMVTVVDSSTTGIANLQPNSLIVHPNPADECLYVSSKDQASNAVFVLYNLLGQVLIIKEIEGEVEVAIPVGNLADGIDFCKLLNSEVVQKIVVAH